MEQRAALCETGGEETVQCATAAFHQQRIDTTAAQVVQHLVQRQTGFRLSDPDDRGPVGQPARGRYGAKRGVDQRVLRSCAVEHTRIDG